MPLLLSSINPGVPLLAQLPAVAVENKLAMTMPAGMFLGDGLLPLPKRLVRGARVCGNVRTAAGSMDVRRYRI